MSPAAARRPRDAGSGDDRAVVDARGIHRTYRMKGENVHALRGVDLAVEAGDFLAVTGPSGSGKSTLLHLLGAVDTPSRGRVVLGGTDPASLSSEARARLRLATVGLVFQRFHLLPMLSARENVELPMAEAGAGRRERRSRAHALLERVGLSARAEHRPGELSGGERQRVAVARALANRPALLLADEPTGELDRATGRRLLDLFRELADGGTAVVVATHDLELAGVASRRLELVDGRIEPEGAARGRRPDDADADARPDDTAGGGGPDDAGDDERRWEGRT